MDKLYQNRNKIALILLILITLVTLPKLKDLSVTDLLRYQPDSPLLASLGLLGLYLIKPIVTPIPIVTLNLAAGVFFHTTWALSLSLLGVALEISLGFYLGRHLGQAEVDKLTAKNKKMRKFFSFNQKNNDLTCFLARLIHLPFDLVNLFFGAAGISYKEYLIPSLLGIYPGTIAYVLAADSLSQSYSWKFIIPLVIARITSIILFLLYKKLRKTNQHS